MESKVKSELKEIDFKKEKFRSMAKTTEFIGLAICLGLFFLIGWTNLWAALITFATYLVINGVLIVSVSELKARWKKLKDNL